MDRLGRPHHLLMVVASLCVLWWQLLQILVASCGDDQSEAALCTDE